MRNIGKSQYGGISRRFRRVAVQPDNRRITNINLLFTEISSRPRGQGGEKQINKNNADCPLGVRRTSVISRILRVGDPPLPPPHMCKCGYGAPRRCAGRAPHCTPPYTRSRARAIRTGRHPPHSVFPLSSKGQYERSYASTSLRDPMRQITVLRLRPQRAPVPT